MSKVQGFQPAAICNIALVGHTGAGKTTLAEAILHRTGAIPRAGSVTAATTTSDFEPAARAHQHSTSSPELIGHAMSALPAIETAVIVVSATSGIEIGTRALYHAAGEAGLARMIVVNRIDENLARLPTLVEELRASFGPAMHCINLPCNGGKDVVDCFDHDAGSADFGSVADVHKEMLESTIEVDDADLERYLSGETIDPAKLRADFVEAMNRGHVVPILFTCATSEVGVDDLIHVLVQEAPSPANGRPP